MAFSLWAKAYSHQHITIFFCLSKFFVHSVYAICFKIGPIFDCAKRNLSSKNATYLYISHFEQIAFIKSPFGVKQIGRLEKMKLKLDVGNNLMVSKNVYHRNSFCIFFIKIKIIETTIHEIIFFSYGCFFNESVFLDREKNREISCF